MAGAEHGPHGEGEGRALPARTVTQQVTQADERERASVAVRREAGGCWACPFLFLDLSGLGGE